MPDLLWMLLPLAAASGWWAGRHGVASRQQVEQQQTSREYFKGLNYLLNEQQDKAIEVFLRMVEVDLDTVETHLALGNLFRQRGEVDRAIRIHQNLAERKTLSRDQHAYALQELARDYLHAGLLDRAEALFNELLTYPCCEHEALQSLLIIYEREHEWESAIEMAQRLAKVSGRSRGNIIAHYFCELADASLRRSELGSADHFVEQALAADSYCVRASILQGDIASHRGAHGEALEAYQRVELQDSAYVSEVVERLLAELVAVGDEAALERYLRRLEGRYNGFSVVYHAALLIRQRRGEAEAKRFFKEQILKRPSLKGLKAWVESEVQRNPDDEGGRVVLDLLDKLVATKPKYQCHQCGFQGKLLYWQCPSCSSWNSITPIIGIEGE